MDTVLAAATIAGIIGVAINGSLAAIEQRLFRWHYRQSD
jgi:ABC-type nitrate/sulfonate/bicarbonate transport system permease component